MSPGVNDGPRNTGTLPKSNRRSDRNRERSAANQQIITRPLYRGDFSQHPNNLLQLDWQPVSEREPRGTTKNSNTRSTSSAPSVTYHDFSDFASEVGTRQENYAVEDSTLWQRMVPPIDSRTQSPPRLQGSKSTNVDKMPDRGQVESRLSQIRDYIRVTSTMMDSLNQSNDPRAQAQHEKLSKMVEDLYDSETKLAKLLEDYQTRRLPDESGDHPKLLSNQMRRFTELLDVLSTQERFLLTNPPCRNGDSGREDIDENEDGSREAHLRRKMEESQRKLAQLQEHQANLVGMQLRARERLNEARQAQQALLLQENQTSAASSTWEGGNRLPQQQQTEQLESETAALRGKLAQLQSKKKRMDHLVAELQAVELSDRGSCSSEGSRAVGRDKAAELDAMKAQLAHLKVLMEEATRVRESVDSASEAEPEGDTTIQGGDEADLVDEEAGGMSFCNSFDHQSEPDDVSYKKSRNSVERPTIEQVQAARAELHRLKQPTASSSNAPPPNPPSIPNSTPPPSLLGFSGADKKQSNNVGNSNNAHGADLQSAQVKRRQLEELMRKEQSQTSSLNRDVGGSDWTRRRGSNSQMSHTSTPSSIWPLQSPVTAAGGPNDQNVDGISSSENLLDIGPQVPATENGFPGNFWGLPPSPVTQPQTGVAGLAEYYRQLLLGSQAQQLQMMGTTMQQCCQLIWSQQRELQSMRAAITQLQLQQRQSQAPVPRSNNSEGQEDYSNLSRPIHHLGSTLDAVLPPSSSLPNLVSLPNPSITPVHPVMVTPAANSQQQHHQQLNNQVPPGNRANNYWDNFRSYSRQNLLSGSAKTVTDHSTPAPAANASTSSNSASGGVNSSLIKDKRNREHGADNLPLPTLSGTEAQYSLNLQLQSNLQQQERDRERESAVTRSNILSNETHHQQQQVDNIWEDNHSSFRLLPGHNEDYYSLHHLSGEMRDVLGSLVAANRRRPDYLVIILREIKAISEDHRLRPRLLRSLRALQIPEPPNNPLETALLSQNEATDQTASESCQSSDDDSDLGAWGPPVPKLEKTNISLPQVFMPRRESSLASPSWRESAEDHCDNTTGFPAGDASAAPSTSITPGYNEDLAEADQSRPEASNNQQIASDEGLNQIEENETEPIAHGAAAQVAAEAEVDLQLVNEEGDVERTEDVILDRIPTRLYHH
ncbi:uncharacterized protein LOC107266635 isoform X3 [Cephus cinctus]|uniref:Uncharacterized protein LOC107266635 isoform X3 n=1 Tax=Cephus cinctus TaxID=211228 RepID=A0AAJ7BRR5_CEPCN|nr:uncharacterized protein LOC107266635 isoform X3 [Cephus cinctus]